MKSKLKSKLKSNLLISSCALGIVGPAIAQTPPQQQPPTAFSYEFTAGSQWTWLGGSSSTNQKGVYGIKGQPSSANWPGARDSHTMVLNPIDGRMYMFGGYGYDGAGTCMGFQFVTNQEAH